MYQVKKFANSSFRVTCILIEMRSNYYSNQLTFKEITQLLLNCVTDCLLVIALLQHKTFVLGLECIAYNFVNIREQLPLKCIFSSNDYSNQLSFQEILCFLRNCMIDCLLVIALIQHNAFVLVLQNSTSKFYKYNRIVRFKMYNKET